MPGKVAEQEAVESDEGRSPPAKGKDEAIGNTRLAQDFRHGRPCTDQPHRSDSVGELPGTGQGKRPAS